MVHKITLSVDEMAARTGLSRTFLFGEIKDGRLASMKIGRLRLIHVDDEAAYLKAHRLAPRTSRTEQAATAPHQEARAA